MRDDEPDTEAAKPLKRPKPPITIDGALLASLPSPHINSSAVLARQMDATLSIFNTAIETYEGMLQGLEQEYISGRDGRKAEFDRVEATKRAEFDKKKADLTQLAEDARKGAEALGAGLNVFTPRAQPGEPQ